MSRDEFKRSVVDKLKARVTSRCSNPSCRVPTSAPSGDDQVNNIGIAAHITAAAPGGARYDKTLSPDQRKAIENAIWLCSNCASRIDRDEGRYPVSVLREWKKQAESAASEELGRKLPDKDDATNNVAMALTGLPRKFLPSAIKNVHNAVGKTLENLDPRFIIKTAHKEDCTTIEIGAKEEVDFSLRIRNLAAKDFKEKYRKLLEHGEELELDSSSVDIEGSVLLREVFQSGMLKFSPRKLTCIQKLWLVGFDGELDHFETIFGSIQFGTKSFKFSGMACKDIFGFSYKEEENKIANINIELRFESWDQRDINHLPYFDKIYGLFEKLQKNWAMFSSFENDGVELFRIGPIRLGEWNYINDNWRFLHYVRCCRVVSKALSAELNFSDEFECSADDYRKVCDAADIILGKKSFGRDSLRGSISCEVILSEENRDLLRTRNPIKIVHIQRPERIRAFRCELEIPERRMIIDGVLPKVDADLFNLEIGSAIRVEWLPQENFHCTIQYVDTEVSAPKTDART